ncbi:sialidase family protein [Paenibacillus sp. LHD-117]|uniref:sialidase family protein n=1 Tax=Paenibacillus sp. LHD-117 TaxID=3071412 RepID=UPI0027E0DB58|nr:sialidase family protein [Paenibacillus sp. LHD-117]MDQ6418441.1 sialidase family protein [Paenibacillus sp. LHD-117]
MEANPRLSIPPVFEGSPSLSALLSTDTTDVPVTTNPAPQNEPSIAANLLNTSVICCTANDYRNGDSAIGLYRSTDGGATWSNMVLPLPVGFDAGGDGIVNWGCTNFFLVTGISFDRDFGGSNGSIIAYRSTDNGATFTGPVFVNQGNLNEFNDKNFSAVDVCTTSPFQGNCYVAYVQFTPFGSQMLFQRSLDGGATWSAVPFPISGIVAGARFVQGACVAVGPFGEVYVSWIDRTSSIAGGAATFFIRRSDDGGVTFGPAVTVMNFTAAPNNLNSRVAGWQFRTPTFSYIATDISFGPFAGRVYASVCDFSSGNAHIIASHSSDNGATWTAPVRVDSLSPEASQNFFPYPAVSPASGAFKVTYYSNRLASPAGVEMDTFVAESVDGGVTFPQNIRVTDVSFNPNTGEFGNMFIGDYNGNSFLPPVGMGPDRIISAWTDTRLGNQNIFAGILIQSPLKGSFSLRLCGG